MDKEDRIFNEEIDLSEENRPPFQFDEKLEKALDKVKKIIESEEEDAKRNC